MSRFAPTAVSGNSRQLTGPRRTAVPGGEPKSSPVGIARARADDPEDVSSDRLGSATWAVSVDLQVTVD